MPASAAVTVTAPSAAVATALVPFFVALFTLAVLCLFVGHGD